MPLTPYSKYKFYTRLVIRSILTLCRKEKKDSTFEPANYYKDEKWKSW
jgi:hypothetical protein